MARNTKKPRRALVLFVIFSIAFFVLAVSFSVFYFLRGANLVSTENVDIRIEGPTVLAGGEELALEIEILNRNSIPLEFADLIIEFPDGTRQAADVTEELVRLRESLGTIPSGESVSLTVKAVLFGAENTAQDITVTVEWRVANSNAIFYTDKTYELTLSSSPLGIAVRSEKEAVVGQEQSFVITIVSNAETDIQRAALEATYPFGFTISRSDPKEDSPGIWELGTIRPGEERVVRIFGTLVGQENEERTFRFRAGVFKEGNTSKLGAAFAESVVPVVVRNPFLETSLALNGSTASEVIAAPGEVVRADITWKNNAGGRITNGVITVSIDGAALNPASVAVDRGFYQSANGTIVWDQRTNPELASIAEGQSGRVSFSFSPYSAEPASGLRNPEITINVSASGDRIDEEGVPEKVEASVSRTMRISSHLGLEGGTLYATGPFQNEGPRPPRAERETTYTIHWRLTNYNNSLSQTEVRGTLPSYVRFLGVVSPSGESVRYNPVGGVVIWSVGDVPAGTGNSQPARNAYFKVALTPSVSQIGQSPDLVTGIQARGLDRFTKTTITRTLGNLNTELTAEGDQTGSGSVGE